MRNRRERGAALITVLLLISVMSAVAVAMTDDLRFVIRRATSGRLDTNAQWHALGAETLARETVERSWKANPTRSTLADPWAAQGVRFAIDGGSIGGQIRDGGNCFNLNSVVDRTAQGTFSARDAGLQQYQALLRILDFDPAKAVALASSLADWIDSDSAPLPRGAEDATYAVADPPYRTSSTLLSEPSELRAIAGYDPESYDRLRPFVCTLPDVTLMQLNVNTLEERDAVLLVTLFGDRLRLSEAQRIIAAKPLNGYDTAADFLAEEGLAGLAPTPEVQRQFAVRTRYFNFNGTVALHQANVMLSSLIEVDDSGRAVTRARRYGEFE